MFKLSGIWNIYVMEYITLIFEAQLFSCLKGFMLLLFVGFMRVLGLQFGIVDWNLEYLGDGVHLGKAKIKPHGVFV